MRKLLMWLGWSAGGLALIVIGFVAFVYARSEALLAKRYETEQSALVVERPIDAARGEHLAEILGCVRCHGENLQGGTPLPGAELFGAKAPPNLTLLAESWSDTDFVRAIRKGVLPDGTSLIVMSSSTFANLTDADTAALLQFVRSRPRGGDAKPPVEETFLKRAMAAVGMAPYQAEILAKNGPAAPADLGGELAAGRYLTALTCVVCHGQELKGAPAPPFFPEYAPPDLSLVLAYSLENFARMLRSGQGIGGQRLNVMSIQSDSFKHFTDEEIQELYRYLVAHATKRASSNAQ